MNVILPRICPCCGQPRGIAHLIELYERSFVLLERLVPELDLPFDTPEKLEEDRPFEVVFPSEDRRGRDGNGSSFSGTVEISYEVVKNSEPIVLEIEIKGVLDP